MQSHHNWFIDFAHRKGSVVIMTQHCSLLMTHEITKCERMLSTKYVIYFSLFLLDDWTIALKDATASWIIAVEVKGDQNPEHVSSFTILACHIAKISQQNASAVLRLQLNCVTLQIESPVLAVAASSDLYLTNRQLSDRAQNSCDVRWNNSCPVGSGKAMDGAGSWIKGFADITSTQYYRYSIKNAI